MCAQPDTRRKLAGRARLRDEAVGTLVHAVLAELLKNEAPITGVSAAAEADRQLPRHFASTHRQSLRQRVSSAAVRYETNFRRADWRLIASEANAGDVRFDLVFLTSGGEICCDEIKTGTAAKDHVHSIAAQAEAQLAAGIEAYGSTFSGVRVVLLAANESVWIDKAGGTSR